MKFKNVIFDWDGTLGMTIHLWLRAYEEELQRLGFSYAKEVIVQDFFYEHDKAAVKYPEIDFPQLGKDVQVYVQNHALDVKPYPDAADVIEQLLHADVKICLVSSSIKDSLHKGLKGTELEEYFELIIGGDDITHHKPHPEPINLALARGGFEKEDTIIIGDSRADILAARSAGISSCAFLPAQNEWSHDFEEVMSHNPDYSVNSLQEFAELILK